MDFQILSLLTREEVGQIVSELSRVRFVDGKATSYGAASRVKHNLQADRSGAPPSASDEIVSAALRRNRQFQIFAHPKRVLAPSYARYEPGMEYGSHVDGAIMGGAQPMRADLAMSIFLSPPESYDGGELTIEALAGAQEIKLAAGEAVVYPASTLHRVAPVTRGVRLVAVTWAQSVVRDERLRSVLYDLAEAVQSAEDARDSAGVVRLSKCYHNLLRYAADL